MPETKPEDQKSNKIAELKTISPESSQAIDELAPGFFDYETSKSEKIGQIKKPIIHGTGSLALERIITQGFITQSGTEVMHGERAAISQGTSDVRPISFAELDSLGQGEAVAHFYAMLVAGKPDLIFDSAKIANETRVESFLRALNGKGIDDGVELKTARAILKSKPDQNPGLTREWVRKDTDTKIELMSQEGAYTFNPELMKANISLLEQVINGNFTDPQELGECLMRLDCLNDIRYYYSEKGAKPEPWSMMAVLLERAIQDITDSETVVGNQMRQKLESMKHKLEKFESMDPTEREKLASQYPCVILLEGDGLELRPVDWMISCQELHCEENVSPDKIRQIRVPQLHVEEVKAMLDQAGLSAVEVIPFEYYEIENALSQK